MGWAEQLAIIGQVALAGLLGGVVGLDRQLKGKPAGLRTHMFIAMASAFFVILARFLLHWFASDAALPPGAFRGDPVGVIQAIVVGVSFIGGGMIILHPKEHAVEGLTTASSTLLVAAIGLAVGIGQYVIAVGVTILTLAVLLCLLAVENAIRRRRPPSP